MKMNEYLQKRQEELSNPKDISTRMKELQEAERRAREIRESLRDQKKKEFEEKIHNFNFFGMKFRPWTLNDLFIVLFVLAVIVVGAASFMPNEKVSSDTSGDSSSDVGFFSRLFGGFAVKSVENTEDTNQETSTPDDGSNAVGNLDSTQTNPETQNSDVSNEDTTNENADLADYDFEIRYKDSKFTTLNSTGTNMIWYSLSIKNLEAYNIKCNIDHYVNDKLKDDKSTVTVESQKSMDVNIREMKADAVDTLSRVKVVITCWDGANENTKNEKLQKLKFYFS